MLQGETAASNVDPFAAPPADGKWSEAGPHILVEKAPEPAPPKELSVVDGNTLIGKFKRWGAYTSSEGGKTCFVASQPQSSKYQPNNVASRDPVWFTVTKVPAKNIRNEASTVVGYPFAENAKVTVEIDGGKSFAMFTDKDSAWLESPTQDTDLIAAMQRGTRMTVVGKTRGGTVTTDTYSLSGISAALDAIAKECQ